MTKIIFSVLFCILAISTVSVAQRIPYERLKIAKEIPGKKTLSNSAAKLSKPFSIGRADIDPACDSIHIGSQAEIDNFLTNNRSCDSIRVLVIDGTGASPAITNLNGLSSIIAVTEKLVIKYTNLQTLAGLSGLTYIGGSLQVEHNPLLTETGLTTLSSIGRISLLDLPLLNSLAGLTNNVDSTQAITIDSTGLSSLVGLEGITTILSFDGLSVNHSNINSLAGLENLERIEGYIRLENLPNLTSVSLPSLQATFGFLFASLPSLANVNGLTNQLQNTSIGTFWFINTAVSSLAGLSNISSAANFYIWSNPNLTTLNGLQGLSGNIDGGFSIWANGNLSNISALSNITSTNNGRVEINQQSLLTSVAGLQNITTIGNGLWITNNDQLSSLSLLNNALLIQDQGDHVKIENNPLLSVCSVPAICNYLNALGVSSISNNATGCASLAEVTAGCLNCSGGELVTWTGTQDDDWANANNWSPAKVPAPCDTVRIPGSFSFNPIINTNVTVHGLIMENNAVITIGDNSFFCTGYVHLTNSYIYSSRFNNTISFRYAENPFIEQTSLTASNIILSDYTGSLEFVNNNIDGNLSITDGVTRTGNNHISGNQIYGDFILNATSTENSATTSISDAGQDRVEGSAIFNIQTPAAFSIGASGDIFQVGVDFVLNSAIDSTFIILGNVMLKDGNNCHITQGGSTPIIFQNLYTEKFSNSQIVLDQNVTVAFNLRFLGGVIKSAPNKLLIFSDNATVGQYSSASWVSGPVKKIGDEQFTFPIGDDQRQAVLTILAPPNPTDAYTAQYFHVNPNTVGFDTSSRQAPLTKISGKEYWIVNKDAGSSNILISLTYDSTRSQKTNSLYSLRTSQWNGSEWLNKGAIFLSGNLYEASLTTNDPVVSYGQPLTLGYIEPPIVPKITITRIDSVVCRPASFKLVFTLDTLMFSGNDFRVELSDSSGSFSNPQLLALLTDVTRSDSTNISIPVNQKLSEFYRIRMVGNAPPDTSINSPRIAIRAIPSLPITIAGPTTGCIGVGAQKYYVAQKEPGVTYTWTLNGGGSLTTLADTAYITWNSVGNYLLSVTSSNSCGSGPSANRSITVNYPAPSDTASVNKIGRWLYASAYSTSQHALGYHWYRNDTLLTGANSNKLYANIGGVYKVSYYNNCGDGPASNTISFAANSLPQSINFPAISSKTYGDSSAAIIASSTAGFPVSLSIVSGPGILAGNLYSITTTGTVTIKAEQAGDDVYDTAQTIFRTFTVNKASQNINFATINDVLTLPSNLTLSASASSSLPVTYQLISGPANLTGNTLNITGLGTVSVTATQAGDTNYLAAASVNRTFCVRIAELASINGPLFVCPGQTATYKINKVAGLTYNWRLSNGTNYGSSVDSVNITWPSSGAYTLIVSAVGPCGAASSNDSLLVNVVNAVTPGIVTNMLPSNGATGLSLPLNLSWLPASNVLTYDLYIWDSTLAQPSVPFATNITGVNFTVPAGQLNYNKTYNWRVVSRNACLAASGPIQRFRLRPLPDLMVSNVQAPLTANSGQTISFSWRVTNNGPGNTLTNQNWTDAVFLSFDTIPQFNIPPNTNPGAWSILEFPVRPLLVGTKPNVTALDSGQHYDNSISFTLPLNYAQPLYLYVVTNYPAGSNAPLQMTTANDTARAAQAISITLAPTPDLRVDTVLTPSSVFSGSTVNITYKVKNYGVLTPANSSWSDKIYISQSPVFNINTATLLKKPRPNGTYYPDAQDVVENFNGQVLADSFYTRSVQAVIPNFISGTYFIYVWSNSTNSLYEGLLAGNNVGRNEMQIFLTPTPLLTVNNIQLPFTQASVTQPIGLSWNTSNNGFYDNIEKNKGHYYRLNGNCSNGQLQLIDSLGYGSSYWVDKIYLSRDSTGLNGSAILIGEFTQGLERSGVFADGAPSTKCVPVGTATVSQNENTANNIRPGSIHPGTLNFSIPATLAQGTYYVYILPNANKNVFEYPGAPQAKRSQQPILIQRPDLSAANLTVPASINAGQAIALQWNTINTGAGSVFNHKRKDRIFLSNSPVLNIATAQLIATQEFTESVASNGSQAHSYQYNVPANLSGSYYLFIETNFDSTVRETVYTNNISSIAINIIAATPADLSVTNLTVRDTIGTIINSTINYSARNIGSTIINGSWTDTLFISCSPVFNYSTVVTLATRTQNRDLAINGSYTDSFVLNLPMSWRLSNCFPQQQFNNAYFFVRANGGNVIFEGTNTVNNQLGSGLRVLRNPLVDHIVSAFTGPDTVLAGRPFNASWTVRNIGENPGPLYYYLWKDALYFSTDTVLDNNDVRCIPIEEDLRLNTNQTYTLSRSIIAPKLATGTYYIIAVTNSDNSIEAEKNLSNNSRLLRNNAGIPLATQVIQPSLPDLVDSFLTAPTTVALGQPLAAIHRITNNGSGSSYPGKWINEVWLSQDFTPGNTGDRLLSSKNINANINAGGSINDTVSVIIPLNLAPGNYVLISRTDAGEAVAELSDSNNLAFSIVNVFSPAPADLIVEQIIKPDTVWIGYPMSPLQWTVRNNAANAAVGISSDGVYLAQGLTVDSNAQLQGVLSKQINIAPLTSKTESLSPIANATREGIYNLLVRTDLLNNIVETNKDNNTSSAGTVVVRARALKLGIPETTTLQFVPRIYKLTIPDSLAGATIQVLLRSGDSLLVRNEMFVGTNYVPDPSRFDYKYETPNFGNQRLVISSAVAGDYYLYVRSISSNSPVQNISITANQLPFALLTVQSNTGGNAGNVTIKISGSLFVPGMSATLSNANSQIFSSQVYFINSTLVYATFGLRGKSIGTYDVSLTKPDSSVATLASAFSIANANNGGLGNGAINSGPNGNGNDPGCDPGAEAGLNSLLLTEIVVPQKIFAGWPFPIQINFANPTNMDLPAQTRILFNDLNVPIALTQAELPGGTSSCYITITEPGGPPGIIRAGASGSILLYGKAPQNTPGHSFIRFTLK